MTNSILSESTASTSGCEGSRDRQLVDLSQYADRLNRLPPKENMNARCAEGKT